MSDPCLRYAAVAMLVVAACTCGPTIAQVPDHPIIAEVYANPPGLNDGPVGRDPANQHQEYVEVYLPTAVQLDPALDKDALRLTFYEVEGDSSSSGLGLVNYRIDLPTFDLDPKNGLTPGAIARPPSGVVVLGWVDYVGDPPFDLAGTPDTRVGLVNGGILEATEYVFVAINGEQFSGTNNFPVPTAISSIDMPDEAYSGLIQNGSGAYLLVNRDAPGYVELYDDQNIPPEGSADPDLPSGEVLGTDALLDGHAGNDDPDFVVTEQPYDAPTGNDIDLETVLPLGGAFSMLVAQVPEADELGYARLFVDIPKTTDDNDLWNDDPVDDALNAYRTIPNGGPFFPTPGRAVMTTDPPELSVADPVWQVFEVLGGTTGGLEIACANIGGHFAMEVTATPGPSSDPEHVTFSPGDPATVDTGQTLVYPTITAETVLDATHGTSVTAPVDVEADNVNGEDPPVVNPTGATTVTALVLNPTTGMDANGQPFQATAFLAVHGLPRQPDTPNEFLDTSLAAFVAENLGGLADDELGNGVFLLDPFTDLSDPDIVDAMEEDMPDDQEFFINVPSPAGLDDLVTTILNSAEVLAGNLTYNDNFNDDFTAVRAIELDITETWTRGGQFVPAEHVHFAAAGGFAGDPHSGLTDVTTVRGFEFALVDSNVQQAGTLETGATDDFGLIVEVGRTRPGAQVVTGEFVFLSYTGGNEGADIDTLDVPPHENQTVIIYVDLDLLDSVLGCETINRLFVIDGSGNGTLNLIEAFSLNADSILANDDCGGALGIPNGQTAFSTVGATTDGPPHADCDFAGDNQVRSDIWYDYDATFTGDLTVSLCGSTYDTKLAVYEGCGCPVSDANLMACNDGFCGEQSEVTVWAVAGNCYKIRVGGYSGAQGDGIITISGDTLGCGHPDAGSCCDTNGTPFCDDAICCESVCAGDPFCCDAAWDGICAQEAAEDPNCPCGGACCFAEGACVKTSQDNCSSAGGTYQGDGTDCTPNPCGQQTGACCFGDTCQDWDPQDEVGCQLQGGYFVADATCGAAPCDCSAYAVPPLTDPRADTNCDGHIDGLDVTAFVTALLDESAWIAEHGGACNYYCANDCNGDGSVDLLDIDTFTQCLLTDGCP